MRRAAAVVVAGLLLAGPAARADDPSDPPPPRCELASCYDPLFTVQYPPRTYGVTSRGVRFQIPVHYYDASVTIFAGTGDLQTMRTMTAGTAYKPVATRSGRGVAALSVLYYGDTSLAPYSEALVAFAVNTSEVVVDDTAEAAIAALLDPANEVWVVHLILDEQLPIDAGREWLGLNKEPEPKSMALDVDTAHVSFADSEPDGTPIMSGRAALEGTMLPGLLAQPGAQAFLADTIGRGNFRIRFVYRDVADPQTLRRAASIGHASNPAAIAIAPFDGEVSVHPDGPFGADLAALDLRPAASFVMLNTRFVLDAADGARCAEAQHAGGDWPSYGRNLANTRTQEQERTITPGRAATLRPAWVMTAALQGQADVFTGTPVVAGGCVYVAGVNNVYAINADTGEVVWRAPVSPAAGTSVAVDGGRVFVHGFSTDVGPTVTALDAATGGVLWRTTVSPQPLHSEFYASPVAFGDMVFSGLMEDSEFTEDNRRNTNGSFTLLDAATGDVLRKTYVIPAGDFAAGYTGGNIWATPAVDLASGYAYVGTAATYSPGKEHPRTNAILKIDVDRARDTFGDIVGVYSGTRDYYYDAQRELPCTRVAPGSDVAEGATGTCATMDLDFGASPNLFVDAHGRTIIGEMQKSGIYHAVDTETMDPVWTSFVADPHGWTLGSTAYDGARIYGGTSYGYDYLYALDPDDGDLPWLSVTPDEARASPVAAANGVVYTTNTDGVLSAFDARTGVPVLTRPMAADAGAAVTGLGTGVAIARNTVYAPAGGAIVAYRPDPSLRALADAVDAAAAAVPTPQRLPRQDKPF